MNSKTRMFFNGKYVDIDSISTVELAETLEVCKLQLDSEVCIYYNLECIRELQSIINSRECKD